MSIFKSKWIVLRKVSSPQNTDILYTIFSYDYGKIQASAKMSKKEKTLDLWNIIDFEIETNKASSKINKIKNIKISSIFLYEDKEYKIIEQYLKIISTIIKLAPEWVEIVQIFETIKHINKEINIDYTKLILAELKILNILWILKLEDKDITTTKILNFISKNNSSKIFLLTWIDDIILNKLVSKTKI
jgi:recombinational DNA repair protein (RecF pathway)